MDDTGLVRYDAMCHAIAACASVDEAKELRNKARALEVYAQQAMNFEAERKAVEIRILAERRAGELLRETKQNGARHNGNGGDQKSASRNTTLKQETLRSPGITRDQSSKWQQLAEIPKAVFEEALTQPHIKPSTESLLARHFPPPETKIGMKPLNAWARIMESERMGLLEVEPADLFSEMSGPMRSDVLRLAPIVSLWLQKFRRVEVTACAS